MNRGVPMTEVYAEGWGLVTMKVPLPLTVQRQGIAPVCLVQYLRDGVRLILIAEEHQGRVSELTG